MSLKTAAMVLGGCFGTLIVGAVAYVWGRHDGHEDVIEKVDDIREQVKHNPGMDLDDALEAQLTDENGKFVMDDCQEADSVMKAYVAGCGALLAASVFATGSMVLQAEDDKIQYDALEGEMKSLWDGVGNHYCDVFNKTLHVIRISDQMLHGMPEGQERDMMQAYRDGVADTKAEMDRTMTNYLQQKGVIKDKE